MTEHVRYWTPEWQPSPEQGGTRSGGARPARRVLLLTTAAGAEQAVRRELAARHPGATLHAVRTAEDFTAALRDGPPPERVLIWRSPGAPGDVGGAEAAAREYFLLQDATQALLRQRAAQDVRLVHAVVEDEAHRGLALPEYAAVAAFARVVAQERPSFHYRSVALTPRPAGEAAAALLAESELDDAATEVRHDGATRSVRRLRALPQAGRGGAGAVSLRDGGTYLITGGLGGLGRVFAREAARRARVGLVLTGRRPLDDQGRAFLTELRDTGAQVRYIPADIATVDGVEALLREIRSEPGPLTGVIHSAGVIRDSFLLRKTREEATAVLAAKLYGTRLLDEALSGEPLEFFALFSSLAGVIGNLGQADYSFGNAYQDHYAGWRESLRARGLRSGRSVSVGWPLWAETGDGGAMHAADGAEERAREQMGLHPLAVSEGVRAFHDALAQDAAQVVVVKGEDRTWDLLAPETAPAPATSAAAGTVPEEGAADPVLLARTRDHLVRQVSRFTKLPVSDIRTHDSFGRYGVESIMIIGMTEELERDLGPLPKTLFFEYDSVDELAEYLARTVASPLRALFGLGDAPAATAPAAPPAPAAPAPARTPAAASGKWALLRNRGRAAQEPAAEAAPRRHPEPAPRAERREQHVRDDQDNQDIAIIGLAGRYPQADDLDAFWDNLRHGRDAVTEIPARRWDHRPYWDPEKGKPGTSYSRWGGFMEGVELFDPLFFSIPPVEAEYLDPQERLFLETSWQAVEDAGYAPGALAGRKVGVFAGVMFGLYQLLATDKHGGVLHGHSSYASVANRVSYFFDFRGPSVTVDTMCSSSLVAVHQACATIRSGECEVALAGGVNVMTHPSKYVQLSQGGFLSTDGRCRAFGEGGDGYVPGEGVGAVVLKSLRQARADGDHVYAVIKGSAVNSGGRTSGYSVPNPQAQAAVIGEALAAAAVSPRDISYVEAHGTGTALGDPIEITGLTKAYRLTTQDRQFCGIGSVKSNIGHLESAAGMAALTKVILQLRHRELVPSLHTTTLNSLIDFDSTPFSVQRRLGEWKSPAGVPRRAGVSAFGAGGTNAHLILEEAPPELSGTAGGDRPQREELLLFSARDPQDLANVVRRALAHLDRHTAPHPTAPADGAPALATAETVRDRVRAVVADALSIRPGDLDDQETYTDLGLDAYATAACHERLQEELGTALPAELLHEEPSVASTVTRLTDLLTGGGHSTGPTPAETAELPRLALADLAFTLQTGRDAMAERLAVRARTVAGLRDALRAHLGGERDIPGVWSGSADEQDRRLHSMLRHDVTQKYTRQLLAEGRLDEVADMWVVGAEVDWAAAWADRGARRLSLPTYPFAREPHWILPVEPDGPLIPPPDAPPPTAPAAAPPAPVAAPAPTPSATEPADQGRDLYTEVLDDLKARFSTSLNIPVARLKPRTSFEDYGIDSIRITQLNKVLEEGYGALPTSLLFTYKDLESLARHLTTVRRERLPREPRPASPRPEAVPAPATVGDIAIIGLSGRYPQAPTLEQFADNLAAGRDSITEIPAERWDHRDYPEVDCRWGGFIDDALGFDPSFFNLSPNAAAYMDPQERQFVQAVWHCLEDAGYTPEAFADPEAGDRRGNVAVYAGVTFNEYGLYGAADLAAGKTVPLDAQLYSVANRISYLLNLRGPSLVVDTACSSSLYAIHLACESLRHGESEVAIAGGVNLSLHPSKYLTLGMFNFLSPEGHCKSFGDGGNGYVPGEGVGAVLLKPLDRALADGDHIHAVIKGSAVNHGGKTNGYTVPNPVAQAEVVRTALERAGVEPGGVSYLEAHGTGTSLGDTIEIEALSTAFDGYPADGRHCAIGSVKSNVGHLEAAAGISQLTKVVLQMRRGRLFPSRLNSERLNQEIDFGRTPFRVQLAEEPWEPPAGEPRRAGISSFGVGGVNVHLVLEEHTAAPRPEAAREDTGSWLVPLSARTPQILTRYAERLLAFLQTAGPGRLPELADLAFTLQTGRRELSSRVAFTVTDHADLAEQLKGFAADGRVPVATGELADTARRWVAGEDVDLAARWTGRPVRRTPLPGYPFETDTHWMYTEPVRGGAAGELPAAAGTEAPAAEGPDDDGVDHAFLRRLAAAFPGERAELMNGYLQQRIAELLGFTGGKLPETDRGYFELGMDSITSTQTHNLLEQLFDQELDLQLFFNYPTIEETSEYLLGLLDLDPRRDSTTPATRTVPAPDDTDAPVWLFTRDWTETGPAADPEAHTGGTVLLLDTGDELRTALAGLPAARRPERVVLVRPGTDGFRVLGDDTYEVDPLARADHERLLARLADEGRTVDRVIHAWSADRSESDPERIQTGLDHGVYALTAFSQALLTALPGQRVTLLYTFAAADPGAAPENRAVAGLMRAVRMENPSLVYKTFELTGPDPDEAAAALMAEFDRPDEDVELRHDGTRRWTRSFRPVPAAQVEAARAPFGKGGVYLITGGPGGLAGLFGRYLCQDHQATVVLVGRRPADPERLAELESWSRDGARAAYLQADIGDRRQVEDLVGEIRSRFGPVTGVIHSAGALRDGPIKDKRPEEMAEVLKAKVFGTRNLDEALRGEPLEHFVMFSSLAAVLGNFGQSDYCYANSYLDSFAEYREELRERGERSGRTLSVNWSFWRSGGMETSDAILTWMRKRLGTVVIEGPEGWEALRTTAALSHPQVVTVKGDIAKIGSLMGVSEEDIAATVPVPERTAEARAEAATTAPGTAEVTAPAGLFDADATPGDLPPSSLDGMDEDALVALLRNEIELSENEGC
ncbi:SDR family NAD(P)-dependent oxidoreductase [Streptomyces sp. NPDC058045]|uniref:SDR family NAD(P)-dependent oxidoreductase n=1 Tax=Streptomyces sp. NPDC058045 TaxID=3346311 RepID=UPI0036E9148A